MNKTPDQSASSEDDDSPDYVARILKGSGSVLSGSVLAKVIGFILNVVLTRGLGTVRYGVYSLGHIVFRVARDIAALGLQNGVVRFGAPHYEQDKPARLKGTFLATGGLGAGMGILLGVVLFTSAPWLASRLLGTPDYATVFQIFACGLPFYVLTFLLSRMARAMGHMQLDVLLGSILQPTIFLFLASGLLLTGQGLVPVVYAFLISTILATVASVYGIYSLFPDVISTLSAEYDVRSLLRFSLPIIGVSLASIGLTYADRVMLGIYDSAESVGIYQAASKMSVQIHFVLYAVNATFSPIISDLYHGDKRGTLAQLYSDTVRWIILITLPVCIVLVVFAPQIMSIFGEGFRNGANVLRILSLAFFIVAAVGSVGQILQMSDHQDWVLLIDTCMAVANIGLNWILIQWYGSIGAAVATGLTQAAGNLVQIFALYHFTRIQPFRWNLWKPFTATAGAGFVGWVTYSSLAAPFHWIIGIPTIFLVYGGLIVALGLHSRDHSIIVGLWTRLKPRLLGGA